MSSGMATGIISSARSMVAGNSDRINIADVRQSGHCVRGARAWFAAQALDFRDFLNNGIAVEQVEALHDGYADQIIARKRAREAAGGE